MTATAPEAGSQIPPPPRAINASIRRRIWNEPGVRFCWLMAAALGLIAALFAIDGFERWRWQTALISDGLHVDATIRSAGGTDRAGASFDPSNAVQLQFLWRGQPYVTSGLNALEDYGRFVTVGDPVKVRVDPNDPENWTFLTEATPLGHRLLPALLILPAAPLTLLAGVWRRWRILQLLGHGESTAALVLRASISALAPRVGTVRCTPSSDGDQRVFTVYPRHRPESVERGDDIELLALGQRAVAAEWLL